MIGGKTVTTLVPSEVLTSITYGRVASDKIYSLELVWSKLLQKRRCDQRNPGIPRYKHYIPCCRSSSHAWETVTTLVPSEVLTSITYGRVASNKVYSLESVWNKLL